MNKISNQNNVLLVGDTSTAFNYGSIAVSDALLRLYERKSIKVNDVIDYRSFLSKTPLNGFEIAKEDYIYNKIHGRRAKLKYQLENFKLLPLAKALSASIKPNHTLSSLDIPTRFDQYDEFYLKVKKGEIFQYEKKLLERNDAVVINGEGAIVGGVDEMGVYNRGGLYVLFFAYLAKRMNKYCAVINHTVDPQNSNALEIIKNVYPTLDQILVREKLSLCILEKNSVRNATFVPDALFSFKRNERQPPPLEVDLPANYVCLGDSSGIRSGLSSVKWDVAGNLLRLINLIKDELALDVVFVDGYAGKNVMVNAAVKRAKCVQLNLSNCDFIQLYDVLTNARALISGRWHMSILSMLASTPIVMWGADSHKTKGLYDMFNYPHEFYEIDELPNNLDRIVSTVNEVIKTDHANHWMQVQEYQEKSELNATQLINW